MRVQPLTARGAVDEGQESELGEQLAAAIGFKTSSVRIFLLTPCKVWHT
jgi:hypothetical protein